MTSSLLCDPAAMRLWQHFERVRTFRRVFLSSMQHDFIQARNYTKSGDREIKWIVLHTMENPEKPKGASAVAHWFASDAAPKASAHYCVDNAEVWQCVGELDVAWGAPGANRYGI